MKINYFIALTVIICCFCSCKSEGQTYTDIRGEVFGTYYRFQIDSDTDFQPQIDSVFKAIDYAANSYVDNSEVSVFNTAGNLTNPSATFVDMLRKAQTYHQQTHGYFDPTLYPLISAWGFGLKNRSQMDSMRVDSLLRLVAFNKFMNFDKSRVKSLKPGVKIDLSAMGEGYAIDAITSLLDDSSVANYMIEIGGEMKCKGKNSKSKICWKIGIENPDISVAERGSSLMNTIELNNKAISTSGNYRKFYTDSLGNKYSHIIDPKTGYPVKHGLLSVSIVTESSTTADVFATACMAMGTEKAIRFIEEGSDIEGFLIYSENGKIKTWYKKGGIFSH